MPESKSHSNSPRELSEVFSGEQLRQLYQQILASGALGRSRHYQRLLEFLIDCAIEGRQLKELDIAVEALGKAEDFDVASDSSVRVYIHQLRKKLDQYYLQHEPHARQRLIIPRGQYRLAVEAQSGTAPADPPGRLWGALLQPSRLGIALLSVIAVLLLANLFLLLRGGQQQPENLRSEAAGHPVWQTVLADEQPVLLVMGDYYIFGELNANGNVARMVREFNVNSRGDLEELQFSDFERAENYLDLDLSYMPEGSAFALTRIVPILEAAGKTVNITMMSDLTMADMRSNHIVYVGYISALDKLMDLSFSGSQLQIGRSYDELVHTDSAQYFTSDAGLPEKGQRFRDYGFFASYPVSADTQVILISGMRDAGVMHTAQSLASTDSLNALLAAIDTDTDEAVGSFEALFEVFGVDRMNFDARIVHAAQIDRRAKWQSDLAQSYPARN